MNVRPIELQITIPRTPDASQMQHQQMERPAFEQTLAQQESLRESSEQMQRAAKTDKTENPIIRDEEQRGSDRQHGEGRRGGKRKQKRQDAPQHPYKGRHIDLSL